MKKKGQIALFVIIAIVVIGIIVALVYMNGIDKKDGSSKAQINSNPVHSFIQLCLDETLVGAVEYVALQGGYYNEPVVSRFYIFHNVPYYWLGNKSQVPKISIVEEEISEYIEDNFDYCLNDFSIFEDLNYEIKTSAINVDSLRIRDDKVEVSVDLSTTVKIGEDVVEFDGFDSVISSDLKKAYDFSKQIIEEQKKTPNEMPLGYITEIADANGFEFETITTEDSDVIYTLIFGSGEDSLMYVYVADYDWEVSEDETN
ncbi:hypothetical protein HOE04_00955 [archaeon]|jgi:hypothetical protein|nr:hypothetical protein [archaeon]